MTRPTTGEAAGGEPLVGARASPVSIAQRR
jgi:hypothetical protein